MAQNEYQPTYNTNYMHTYLLLVTEHRNIEAVNLYCYYTDFIW